MSSKEKLKSLAPVLMTVFPPEDLSSLQKELLKKNVLKGKAGKQSNVTSAVLLSSIKEDSVSKFVSVLEKKGETSLAELSNKIIHGAVDEHIDLMLKYWVDIVSCKSSLSGLEYFIRGVTNADALTPHQWIEIVCQLIDADSKDVRYFLLQVIKNVTYDKQQILLSVNDKRVFVARSKVSNKIVVSSQKHITVFYEECRIWFICCNKPFAPPFFTLKEHREGNLYGRECFSELFKPIFKSKLEPEHFIAIAKELAGEKLISNDDLREVVNAKKKKTHKSFLDVVLKNFNQQFLQRVSYFIEKQGFSSFAGILRMYFEENNALLLWALCHWSKLTERQPDLMQLALKHCLFSSEELFAKGDMLVFDVLFKAVSETKSENVMFLNQLKTIMPHKLILDVTQVFSKVEEALKPRTSTDSVQFENEVESSKRTHSETSSSLAGKASQVSSTCDTSNQQQIASASADNKARSSIALGVGRGRGASLKRKKSTGQENQTVNIEILHDPEAKSEQFEKASYESRLTGSSVDAENNNWSPEQTHSDSSSIIDLSTHSSPNDDAAGTTGNAAPEKKHSYNLRDRNKPTSSAEPNDLQNRGFDSDENMPTNQRVSGVDDNEKEDKMEVDLSQQKHIEFCLLVDKKCDLPVEKSGKMLVNLHLSKHEKLPLTYDEERGVFFCSIHMDPSINSLVYKYLWCDSKDNLHWERLPSDRYGIVDRIFNLKQDNTEPCCTILFDVATFKDEGYCMESDLRSMYARNIIKHLPKINLMKLGSEKSRQFDFDTCLNELENWYGCAVADVNYVYRSTVGGYSYSNTYSARIFPSCISELGNYFSQNADYGSKKDKTADSGMVCQRLLVYLAILVTLKRHNVEIHSRNFQNLCAALAMLEVSEADLKLLYDELKSSNKVTTKDVGDAILFLHEQIKQPLLFLHLIPLYHTLMNNGCFSTEEKVWKKSVAAFTDKKQFDACKTEHVDWSLPYILGLSKIFPQLLELFQSQLSTRFVLHMIDKRDDVIFLSQKRFLISLLESSDVAAMEKYFSSQKLNDWIACYIAEIEKRFQSQTYASEDTAALACINQCIFKFLHKMGDNVSKKKSSSILEFLRLVIKFLGYLSRVVESDDAHREIFEKTFSIVLKTVTGSIKSDSGGSVTNIKVQRWNCFLVPRFKDVTLTGKWQNEVSEAIQERLYQKLASGESNVLEVFESKLDDWQGSAEVQSCFSEAVFKHAMSLTYMESGVLPKIFRMTWDTKKFKKMASLFERIFNKSYAKWNVSLKNPQTSVLKFALQWPFFVQFFKFFGEPEKLKALTTEVQSKMSFVTDQLTILERNLQSGMILFQHFDLIFSLKSQSEEVFSWRSKDPEAALLLLTSRCDEMRAYLHMKTVLEYYLCLCNASGVDLIELKTILELSPNDQPFCNLVERADDKTIKVIFFDLNEETMKAANEMQQLKVADNEITKSIWKDEYQKLIEEKEDCDDDEPFLKIEDTVTLWKAVKRKVISLKQQLVSGDLILRDVQRLFENIHKENFFDDILRKVIKGLCDFPVEDDNRHGDIQTTISDEEYSTAESSDSETFVDTQFLELSNGVEQVVQSEEDSLSKNDIAPFLQDHAAAIENEIGCSERLLDDLELAQDVEQQEDHGDVAVVPVEAKELVIDDNLINERVEQISHFFSSKHDQDVADVFLELKETLNLQGRFSDLDVMLKQKNMSYALPINRITHEVIKASRFMSNISLKSLKSVRDFLEHKELIKWLRENMNRKEVKVMSDLAMISAGENQMEVDKVSCFLSAVMGFAPFLFDLKKNDADTDLEAVIEAFKKLPSGDAEQCKLKAKWDKTAQYLDWLKQIKDFHGSVEKSSLARAQDINNKGIYKIGGEKEKIPTIENSLTLNISASDKSDGNSMTSMNISNLHSLESRLILIAGEAEKGLDAVKVFTEVLTLVENLTNVYVKLKSAGCLLFSNWTARIWCRNRSTSSDDDVGMLGSLEIHFDDHSAGIMCNENVAEELKKLTAIMEEVYEEWKQSLDNKRNQFYHLNHFNIQQIMYLCQELAGITSMDAVPDQVCTLLKFVKPNVRGDEIIALLKEATKHKQNEEEIEEQKEEAAPIPAFVQKRRMVRQLVDEGINEKLAKAAVQFCGIPLDKDECFVKALELEPTEYDADGEVNALNEKFDKEVGFGESTSEVKVIQSVVDDRSKLTLQNVIAKIMKKLSNEPNVASVTVKTVCKRYLDTTAVTSLNDCISIEHLGILLEKLRDRNDIPYPDRQFPPNLEEGKPNLVISPESEMFSTLLSLYMHASEEPLPNLFEVLLCSENSTEEEVDLFVRRAICVEPQMASCIFCLAFADRLTFKVADATNSVIKQLEKQPGCRKYKLVVLCSASQHSDYISSFLSENRMDYQNRFPIEDVQAYLKRHLRLHERHSLTLPKINHYNIETSVLFVTSNRAGMGKSLHIDRWREHRGDDCRSIIIRLLDKQINEDEIMQRMYESANSITNSSPHFVHFDITPSVQHGFSPFFFNLMVLGGFKDSYGTLWRRQAEHVYFIEFTTKSNSIATVRQPKLLTDQNFFNMLPNVRCLSPCEILIHDQSNDRSKNVLKMDQQQFENEMFQRPYQYLNMHSNNQNLDRFTYFAPEGSPSECIEVFLKVLKLCHLHDPTWSELRHFASFLNTQLRDCEQSIFCSEAFVGGDSGLSGFKNFVVRFMIRMSQDFATPSLVTCSEHVSSQNEVFDMHQLRRRWEKDVHPYLLFNEDHESMTFLNFSADANGNLLNPKNHLEILDQGLLGKRLMQGLKTQRVALNQNFDGLSRSNQLIKLYRVMGLEENPDFDPDPTYELTTDNALKILAIHMRLRCGIPVVVMGETGCGKTRMVEFMSKLKAVKKIAADRNKQNSTKESIESVRNMVIIKVHGGITVPIIQQKMREAAELARKNKHEHGVDTLLFLDEANTTEAIYAIKEYVCDGTIDGKAMQGSGLQIVCACNPYKKHSEEALKNMTEAGLGFRIKTEDTTDKLGDVPMRQLVYRVIELPPSMKPLVWDFGQLSDDAERIYIQQMVEKLPRIQKEKRLMLKPNDSNLIVAVLSTSQSYMRKQRSQCLFVSLRDVERCLQSFLWFFRNGDWLYPLIDQEKRGSFPHFAMFTGLILRTLIHAIGMCYHVTLDERNSYRVCVSRIIYEQFGCTLKPELILDELVTCQRAFSKNLNLEDSIARNEALMENTFMITMCIEMRIPLFLIGKPGSSKSLAKTVVTDAMQGGSSESEVYQKLKQIHVLSFQCSAVSDASGIASVFNQCEKVQANQNPDKFVSVVVLDEVGLAEDSPKMPLKVLHPLLEGSSADLEENTNKKAKIATGKRNSLDNHRRVGFVGISNWALDPAKMNRGIFVIRGDPSKNDLQLTARGIFSDLHRFKKDIDEVVQHLTDAYLEIRNTQHQEFFGLRDYYGLLKMVFAVIKQKDVDWEYFHVSNAIKRNFSGGSIDCFEIFLKHLNNVWPEAKKSTISVKKMIKDNLESVNLKDSCESRFLLLLTNRFAAINLINSIVDGIKFQVIFGSSFPRDSDYIELCRNINKIKICMESGCTVVLLNLRDLYESLYDALNQHYVTFAGQRYVDLGLGGHRVKCRVSEKFRLIVIEDKNVVYDEFPIPLINRLEKYVFTSESILDGDNVEEAKRLNSWIQKFVEIDIPLHKCHVMKQFLVGQCLPGYTEDSSASAVLNAANAADTHQSALLTLINTATVDSIYRLHQSKLKKEAEKLQKFYLRDQSHDNLVSFFQSVLHHPTSRKDLFNASSFLFEITSCSHILSETDREKMELALELPSSSVMLLTLQQFQTLDEYSAKVKMFFEFSLRNDEHASPAHILLVQCPQALKHSNLIACARFTVKNIVQDMLLPVTERSNHRVIIAFLYTIDRLSLSIEQKSSFNFHSSDFTSVFVDELRPSVDYMGPPSKVFKKSVSEVFQESMVNYKFEFTKLPSKFANEGFVLDPLKLVRDSIPGALVRVRSRTNEKIRNRVHLLQPLFQNDHPVSVPFQETLLVRIANLLKERDNNIGNPLAWSVDEACSSVSLHEGGTFTKTLWLRLKKIVGVVLAKIVSVLDEDDNLNLLCDKNTNPVFVNFWLQVFRSDIEVCKFSLSEILSDCKEMEVRGTAKFSCQFPFSRRLTECFTRLWNFAQVGSMAQNQMFFSKVMELRVSTTVHGISRKHLLVLKHYVHDLVHLQCRFEFINATEFQLLVDALMAMFKINHQESFDTQSNFLAVAYSLLESHQPQLQQMHAVFEILPELLDNTEMILRWADEQNNYKDFVVHVFAFQQILLDVEKRFEVKLLEGFRQPFEYQEWKRFLRKILSLRMDMSSSEPSSEILQSVAVKRNALAFVDLFLSVLMPDDVTETVFQHYWSILASLSVRLWKGANILELNNAKFLNIVIRILQSCCKDLFLNLLLSWKETRCNSCNNTKINDPVILPCEHYFCFKCIQHTATISRQCSVCRETFPDDYQLEVAKLSNEKMLEFEEFKQNCTSFFLQYLSTLCFPTLGKVESDATVKKDVWKCLQSLVVGEKETRDMTPIDMESFDEAPTVRSFILQLLLRYNRENTQEILEDHFQKMEKVMSDKKQLMIIYIRCVEDLHQFHANQSKMSGLLSYQEFIHALIQELLESYSESIDNVSQVKTLNVVAAVRFLMKKAAETVHEMAGNENEEVKERSAVFLHSVSDILERCEIPKAKEYFVKHLCRRFGFSDYQQFLNDNSDFYSLIPSEINPESEQTSSFKSSLFVLGNDFIEAQTRLLQVECDDDFEDCIDELIVKAEQSNDAAVQILHAVQSWMSKAVSEEGVILRNDFWKAFLQKMRNLLNVHCDLIDFFAELNSDQLFPSSSAVTALILQEFVMVVRSTISVASDNNLAELYTVMTDLYRITTSFIPTMPLSSFFDDDVQVVLKNIRENHSGGPPKSHLCPSGHVYFIGDCTNPEQLGQCPECKKAIGGTHGKLQPGNIAGVLDQRTQMGYLLPNPEGRPTALTPERNCSKLDVCTIRLFLHAVMLHANNKHQHVMSHLKQPDRNTTSTFLFHQLQIDFKQLMDCLGKSADDTALLLHQVMKKMRTQNFVRVYGSTLSTIQGRKVWEDEFRRNYLSSTFENADDLIEEARKMCWSNQQQSDLERLVYEIPNSSEETIDSDDATLSIDSPYLWNYDINVTISHLRQKLEGLTSHDKREGQLLKLLLNETDLNFVQFLPSILTLQNVLIQRYERKVDANDVDNISLNEYCDEEDRIISDAQFQLYIQVWNAVKGNLLDANHTLKVSKEELAHEMNMESPVSMCLPSTAGRGRCALLMVEYLVEKQNNLLSKCKDLLPNSFTEISVDQLSMDDLICIDDEQALMPLVLSNSQYQVTVGDAGSKHTIVYRFAALEKQVAEKFIINKKFLTKQSLQQIKYLQDTGLGAECENMQNNVKQEPLPRKICQKFDELIARSHLPEICEGVRTLALVVSYLAKLESDPNKLLKQYVTDELFIPSEEANMIPKDVRLCHTMALYERLSWQRSLRFVLSNQDPFVNFAQQEHKENEVSDDEMKQSLKGLDLSLLQLELNSLMLLKSELDLDSSLRDYLIAYIESKTPEEKNANVGWCRGLHKKLRVYDAPRLFKLSVVVEN